MQQTRPVPKNKPLFAIGLAAVSALVLIAALAVAHGIFEKSYKEHLGKLQAMVADASARFDRGDTAQGATAYDQLRFYKNMESEIGFLSGNLKTLNDAYPLLLTRAGEKGSGIADLRKRLDQLAPGLASFRECADEDADVSGSLASLLASPGQAGLSSGFLALQQRNAALDLKLSGLAFSGAIEGSRKAMADGVAKRGRAIGFLVEEAVTGEEMARVFEDTASSPDDMIGRLNELIKANGEQKEMAAGTDMGSYGEGGAAVIAQLEARAARLSFGVAYLTELKAVQQGVVALNALLDQGLASGGKFTARLASWMAWVKDLDALEAQLTAMDAKPEYQTLSYRRTLVSLGLSETGQTLSGYSAALNAIHKAVADSAAIEKEIDSVMKNSKLSFANKVSAFVKLQSKNDDILSSIGVEVPSDLAMGLDSFKAGCQERHVFLEEYMAYYEDQSIAKGHYSARKYYLQQQEHYKAEAGNPAYTEVQRDFYKQLAADNAKFASDEKTLYDASLKEANAHKVKYEASRKKYVPMLDR